MSMQKLDEYGFRVSFVQQIPANQTTWVCQITYRDPLGVIRALGFPTFGDEPPSLEEALRSAMDEAVIGALDLPEYVAGYGINDTVVDVEEWQRARRMYVRVLAWVWSEEMFDTLTDWLEA